MPTTHQLAQLIDGIKAANNWSDPDLVRNAEEKGHELSKSNISRYRKPLVSIKGEVIRALAAGLRVKPSQVAIAAVESMGIQLPSYDAITPEQAVELDIHLSARDKSVLLGLLRDLRSSAQPDAPTEGNKGQEVPRFVVIKMNNGPMPGQAMIVRRRDFDSKPPWVDAELVQEFPAGTVVEPSRDEPVRLVIQVRTPDGTPVGPPRAVTQSQFDQVPERYKIEVIWPAPPGSSCSPRNPNETGTATSDGRCSENPGQPSDDAAGEMSDDDLRAAAAADPLWADYVSTKRPELVPDDGWDF